VSDAMQRTILLVEDNPQILETTTQYLRARGYGVISSDSPLGVSALVRRYRPALIVLDVMMPALDGDALAPMLRAQPGAGATPVVFYSAMEEEQLHRISRLLPGATYVTKSEGLAALYAAIVSRIGIARSHDAEAPSSRPPRD
jgi:two-component system OmpR family response regulator